MTRRERLFRFGSKYIDKLLYMTLHKINVGSEYYTRNDWAGQMIEGRISYYVKLQEECSEDVSKEKERSLKIVVL